jgi:hypothetical protein
MTTKELAVRFGSGDPRTFTGLSPTFIIFKNFAGIDVTPPAISEIGVSTGLYKFSFGYTLSAIAFCIDGGALLSDADRYVTGTLDPIQAIDKRLGSEDQSFGTDTVDPASVYAFSKRFQELLEGNAKFNKSSGVWEISSRGSSQLLRTKTLTNTLTESNKT